MFDEEQSQIETHIKWHIRFGSCLFWLDDWLGIGPLVNYRTDPIMPNYVQVASFITYGQLYMNKIIQVASP